MKCVPVNTPFGSACMARPTLLGLLFRFRRLRNSLPVNGEVRTVHSAQVAATALLGRNHVRRMVALGVKGRRQREHLGRTELHAESARLTALNDDRNATFCHGFPHDEVKNTPQSL